jgi:hypothetical protein
LSVIVVPIIGLYSWLYFFLSVFLRSLRSVTHSLSIFNGIREVAVLCSVRRYRLLQSCFVTPFGRALHFVPGQCMGSPKPPCSLLMVMNELAIFFKFMIAARFGALLPRIRDFFHKSFILNWCSRGLRHSPSGKITNTLLSHLRFYLHFSNLTESFTKRVLSLMQGTHTGFASGGVTCKLGALCFYLSSVQAASFVLRNPPKLKARKR